MKKVLLLIPILVFAACNSRNTQKDLTRNNTSVTDTTAIASIPGGHNAQNSLSYAGVYEGTIPCADCPGIDVIITLDYKENYTKKMTYQGKELKNAIATVGKFVWDKNGSSIKFTGDNDGETYKVIEGALIMLSTEGNEITGVNAQNYVLQQKSITEE